MITDLLLTQDLLRFIFPRHVYTDAWNSSEAPFGSSRKNHRIGRFTSSRHVYTVYAILQEHGVSAYINRRPYFPNTLFLVVVTPSYFAPVPHLSSFVVRALRLCFFLGYVMMDRLPMELAVDIAGRIVEQSYAPMDELASLWATYTFMRSVCGTAEYGRRIPLRQVL